MGRKKSTTLNNTGSRTGGGTGNAVANIARSTLSSVQNGVVITSSQASSTPSLSPARMGLSSRVHSGGHPHRSRQWFGSMINALVVVLGWGIILLQWREFRRIMHPEMTRCQMTYMSSHYQPISLGNEENKKVPPGYGLYHVIDRSHHSHGRSGLSMSGAAYYVYPFSRESVLVVHLHPHLLHSIFEYLIHMLYIVCAHSYSSLSLTAVNANHIKTSATGLVLYIPGYVS